MKNIAILVYDVTLTGGAERVALRMAEEFASDYNVTLVSLFSEKPENVPSTDKYALEIIYPGTTSITLKFLPLARKLRAVLSEKKTDVLFAITAGVVTLAVFAARKLCKTVYCEHSNLKNQTYGKKHILRQRLGAKYADRVVALSEQDCRNFTEMFGTKEEKLLAIPNWVEFNIDDHPYAADSKSIISVGRLEYVKGYDMLVKVAKTVLEKHPDWQWHIYGEGKMRQSIQEDINARGLEKSVILQGNSSQLSSLYGKYSFFVQTSYYEGFPLALVEAKIAKLPAVSFDCPTGPAILIEDGINGYLIPPYDISAMAEKVCELVEDAERRREFSANATRRLELYEKKTVLAQWYRLIEELL